MTFGMKSAIVHRYFKKELQDAVLLLQVDPVRYIGLELIVFPDGRVERTRRQLDENIYEDLEADGFAPSGALEFNIYLQGLNKK